MSAASPALQFQVRWNGRLLGVQRHAVGEHVTLGGSRFDVVSDGVVVDGTRHTVVGAPLSVRCGAFVVRVSDDARLAAARAEPAFDLAWWRTLSMIVILAIGGLVALHLTPKLPAFGDDDLGRGRMMVARAALAPKPPAPPPTKTTTTKKPASSSKLASTPPKPEGASTRTAKERDADRAMAMNALAQMGLTGPMATAGVFGAANEINTALDQLNGNGSANAGPGMGVRGVGDGGSGIGISIGVLNGGRDRGKRPGVNVSDHAGDHVAATVKADRIVYVGGLDRAEIERVMSRAMNRVRYCYERALTSNAGLEGKLTTLFVIGGGGEVESTSIVQSTVSNDVDACVTRVLKSLKFPAPKGGGTVSVTYPFIFTS